MKARRPATGSIFIVTLIFAALMAIGTEAAVSGFAADGSRVRNELLLVGLSNGSSRMAKAGR